MVKAGYGVRMALVGLALLVAAGCSEIYRNHGYAPTDRELAELNVGTDTRETVAAAVGRPSTAELMSGGNWYYVQSRWRHYGARAPEETERQVVAISFDSAGRVENIERFGLAEGRVVPISRRVTETNIKGIGLIRQLLSNIGNINPGQFLN